MLHLGTISKNNYLINLLSISTKYILNYLTVNLHLHQSFSVNNKPLCHDSMIVSGHIKEPGILAFFTEVQ